MKAAGKAVVLFCATGAGAGYAPLMPGTAGSAAALLVYALLAACPLPVYVCCIAAAVSAAVPLSAAAARMLGQQDPPQVVIDEICGMLVTLAGLPVSLQTAVAGFLLFRLLDVLKPFPANMINDRMHGGAGIVLDDIVAGIYANLILRAARLLF